jgi:hypothetical protein
MLEQPTTAPQTRPDTEEPDLTWPMPHRSRLRTAHDELGTAGLTVITGCALILLTVLVLMLGPYALRVLHWITQPQNTTIPAGRLWATIDEPVHRYLAEHSTGLPAGPRTLYTAWVLAGALILIRALRQGATVGVQLGAAVFGALSAGMVWEGTQGPGRPVAAGLAALAWAVCAALALTGSWVTTHLTVVNPPAEPAAPVVPVTVQVPESRIEAVVVDVQQLQVDINGRRLTGPADEQN